MISKYKDLISELVHTHQDDLLERMRAEVTYEVLSEEDGKVDVEFTHPIDDSSYSSYEGDVDALVQEILDDNIYFQYSGPDASEMIDLMMQLDISHADFTLVRGADIERVTIGCLIVGAIKEELESELYWGLLNAYNARHATDLINIFKVKIEEEAMMDIHARKIDLD